MPESSIQTPPAARVYYGAVLDVLARIEETQSAAIARAACLVADTVERDGIVYAFGSGHSLSIAVEFYYRAGGLACVDVVHDKTFGRAERLPGYAQALLDAYPVANRDLLIVISNSGRNALPVEMAMEGHKRGLPVIGITSLAHTRSAAPRNTAGLRLCDVCEVVIDNCGAPGDAAVAVGEEGHIRVGPTSTVAGAFIANSIVSAAAAELVARKRKPPVLLSANVEGGDEHNEPYIRFIRERIRGL